MRKTAFLFLFLCTTSYAGPGGIAGNGGGAWVCRNGDQSIRWAEVVDLVEARREFHLHLAQYTGSYIEVIGQIERKIHIASEDLDGLTDSVQRLNGLSPTAAGAPITVSFTDKPLDVINDYLFTIGPTPETCERGQTRYEQVVNYQGDGEISVNREIFNALSETSKAALVVHEGTYAFRRAAGDVNSVISRRIVGLLFSDLSVEELNVEMDPDQDNANTFFPSGIYELNFEVINSDGTSTALRNDSFSLSGDFTEPTLQIGGRQTWEHATFKAETGDTGHATWNLPIQTGLLFDTPILAMDLDGINYQSVLASQGWASSFAGLTHSEAPYACEAVTIAFPVNQALGLIEVVCAEKRPQTSP